MKIAKIKIAIVVSQFNAFFTGKLQQGAVNTLLAEGVTEDHIEIIEVPGAIEIPLTIQLLSKQNKYDAIIALGCVIRGDTDHYDYVCQQVSYGCMKVMLATEVPVIFGIITTHNEDQAEARVDTSREHKGVEAAQTALRMINVIKKLNVS